MSNQKKFKKLKIFITKNLVTDTLTPILQNLIQ